MAEALLRRRLADLGVEARVSSAGRLWEGSPATRESVAAMRALGMDASGHRARILTPEMAGGADLVLGMAREHVRHAVAVDADLWPRTFTLKELVRRGEAVGPRACGQPFDEWLAKAHAGRRAADLLGASHEDDVADPYGAAGEVFARTAAELDDLTARLVALAWADEMTRPQRRDRT